MTTHSVQDSAWGALADADPQAREQTMFARYTELAALDEGSRCTRLLPMVEAEYALPDEKLYPFTTSRLRSWLRIDPKVVHPVTLSYNAVMLRLPGKAAMRRVAAVQAATKEMSSGDIAKLHAMLPGVFGESMNSGGLYKTAPDAKQAATVAPATNGADKKSKWAFWKK